MYPPNGPAQQAAYGQPSLAPPQAAYGQPPLAPPQAAYGQPPMAQYATGVPPQLMVPNGKWSTGLCDCTDDVSNCCITCWCPCITFGQIAEIADRGTTSCALCQEYRELKNRGFDMAIGWHGNMARQNQGVAMPPFAPAEMKR
nr:hypothetical protein [Tanacetum cinerariifolium]